MNQTPLSAVCCIGILRATYSSHLDSLMLSNPYKFQMNGHLNLSRSCMYQSAEMRAANGMHNF